MFAGQYDLAIVELNKGKEFETFPDYLYGNIARNFLLKGSLSKAEENLQEQTLLVDRESSKNNIAFNKAYIEYVRGNLDKTTKDLKPVIEFYSQDLYQDRVDDSPNLPFWLEGVVAAKNGNRDRLMEMIDLFGERISNKDVNATNYFPVYKFYLYLRILEGLAKRDENLVLTTIEEGKRIKESLGYWSSMFNLPYFFNFFAEALLEINRSNDALPLLNEAVLYNPNHADVRLSLVKVYLQQGQTEMAKTEYAKLVELLSDADEDFFLMQELKKIKNLF
jgi:tetratricopeptide (TPR) repeat protein